MRPPDSLKTPVGWSELCEAFYSRKDIRKSFLWGASRVLAVAALGVGEKLVEGSAVEIFSAEPDGPDLCCVVNVGEGIGGEQDEVGAFAGAILPSSAVQVMRIE